MHARGAVDDTKFIRFSKVCERQGISKMTGERRLATDPDFPKVVRFDDGPRAWRYCVVEEVEAYERLLIQRGRAEKPRPARRRRALKTDGGDTVRLSEIKSVVVTLKSGKRVRIANMEEVLSPADGSVTAAPKAGERGGAR